MCYDESFGLGTLISFKNAIEIDDLFLDHCTEYVDFEVSSLHSDKISVVDGSLQPTKEYSYLDDQRN